MDLTKKLRTCRSIKGMTQADVAEYLEISLNSYNNKEKCNREFTLNEANKLAILLDCKIEEIFFDDLVFKMNTKLYKCEY